MLIEANAAKVDDTADRPRRGADWWANQGAAANIEDRQYEVEWTRVDQKLRGIAARRAALDAEEAHLLRYAEELKLWRGYGYASLLEYMERAMGYAPRTAVERLRVARVLAELPLLADALERSELAHSAVRELSRVAVPDTEAAWLEAAQGKSLREIEVMVSGHRPGDLPSDPTEPRLHRKTIVLEVSPETYDIWRKLHALAAEEHGQRLSDDELIPSLFRRAYGQHVGCCGSADAAIATSGASGVAAAGATAATVTAGDVSAVATSTGATAAGATAAGATAAGTVSAVATSAGPPPRAPVSAVATAAGPPPRAPVSAVATSAANSPTYKLAIKQCPDCRRAWQYSGGRDIEVDPAVAECAACDAIHLGSLDADAPERATTTVTPRKREQVLARDGYCCTVPGCRRNVGLDLHHIEYQSHGGDHALRNLTAICDLHHRAVHFGKLAIRGIAPDQLTFEFRQPRDRRNVTDDDDAPPPRSVTPPPRSVTPPNSNRRTTLAPANPATAAPAKPATAAPAKPAIAAPAKPAIAAPINPATAAPTSTLDPVTPTLVARAPTLSATTRAPAAMAVPTWAPDIERHDE
jgi:hypothetical protein